MRKSGSGYTAFVVELSAAAFSRDGGFYYLQGFLFPHSQSGSTHLMCTIWKNSAENSVESGVVHHPVSRRPRVFSWPFIPYYRFAATGQRRSFGFGICSRSDVVCYRPETTAFILVDDFNIYLTSR